MAFLTIQMNNPSSKNNWGHILYIYTSRSHEETDPCEPYRWALLSSDSSWVWHETGRIGMDGSGFCFLSSHPAQWLWISLFPLVMITAPAICPPYTSALCSGLYFLICPFLQLPVQNAPCLVAKPRYR